MSNVIWFKRCCPDTQMRAHTLTTPTALSQTIWTTKVIGNKQHWVCRRASMSPGWVLHGWHVPEDDDEPIEDVEADTDVSTDAVGNHFQQHLDSKQSAEEHVAVLEDLCQLIRLQPNTFSTCNEKTRLFSVECIPLPRHIYTGL